MKIDIGLLILRLTFGGVMLLSHGLPKLMSYSEKAATWADPIGVGPQASLALAIFAEAFCSLAVVLGLFTRFAVIPLMVTMFVAFVVVHAADPWGKKELAFMYLTAFMVLAITGPGIYSLDAIKGKLFGKRK